MAQVVEDPIAAARAAAGRRDWKEAYDLLSTAGDPLGAEDLELLADAAFWSVRHEESLTLRERAYKAHLDEGNRLKAGGIAVRLALDYMTKGNSSLFNGWQAKGERLLAAEPEALEHGQAALVRALSSQWAGKLDDALAGAELAYEFGERFGSADLQALALVLQGSALVYRGELDRGLALLDEASTSALTGELDPFSSTVVYCVTISSSQGIGDFERARQWTDAANKWCDVENTHGFPGACRVHRSEILWLGGQWEAAEREAVNACAELESYNVVTTAAGYYQIGEIHRRRGDFAKAEEAYAKAFKLGREPQPGQALLRLAQGKVDAAAARIRRSLGDDEKDPVPGLAACPRRSRCRSRSETSRARRPPRWSSRRSPTASASTAERTPLLDGALQISLRADRRRRGRLGARRPPPARGSRSGRASTPRTRRPRRGSAWAWRTSGRATSRARAPSTRSRRRPSSGSARCSTWSAPWSCSARSGHAHVRLHRHRRLNDAARRAWRGEVERAAQPPRRAPDHGDPRPWRQRDQAHGRRLLRCVRDPHERRRRRGRDPADNRGGAVPGSDRAAQRRGAQAGRATTPGEA